MQNNTFISIISTVIIVLIVIIFLFNYNEYLIFCETKEEIDKLNEKYFEKLKESYRPIYDFKPGNIDYLEEIIRETRDLLEDIENQIKKSSRKNEQIEKKINDIEMKINEKNNDINELKRKILENSDKW